MPPSTFNAMYLLPVAAGSALGGMARYAMTDVVQTRADSTFPFGTLLVNVIGCLLIGIFFQFASGRFSPAVQALLTTGFCGGFTTFSTFSYESVRLVHTGLWQRAVLYIGLSVALGLGAFWLGATLVRSTNAP